MGAEGGPLRELQAGDELGGYTVGKLLGRGAMGAVYAAEDAGGRRVALKLLTVADDRARKRFVREAELGQEIDHPNVVKIFEWGRHGDDLFLTMEFVEGRSLGQVRQTRHKLPARMVVEIARALAAGLAELHRRDVTHRDLKPDNIMIDSAGVLKIMDLGLVRNPERTVITKTGALVGTPWYMAPEQVLGHAATPRTDLFAAGLILYELLTGNHPFRSDQDRNVLFYLKGLGTKPPFPWAKAKAGGPLDQFFRIALQARPMRRFESAAQLVENFEGALRAQAAADKGRPVDWQPPADLVDDDVARAVEATAPVVGVAAGAASGPGWGASPGEPAGGEDPPTEPMDLGSRADTIPDTSGGFASPSLSASQAGVRSTGPSRGPPRAALVAVGLALFLVGAFWQGTEAPVLISSSQGFRLEGGRLLVVETDGPAQLRLSGRAPLKHLDEGRTHVFEVPALLETLQLATPGGTAVFAKEAAAIEWREAAPARRSFTAQGDLELDFEVPAGWQLAVRREGGAQVVDADPSPDGARFRLAGPAAGGGGPATLVLKRGPVEIPWSALEAVPAVEEVLATFLDSLERLDPVARMREAGRGEGAPENLLAGLEREGLVEAYRTVRRLLRGPLADRPHGDPLRDRMLRLLPRLLVLQESFRYRGLGYDFEGVPSPFDLVEDGVQDFLIYRHFFRLRIPDGPGQIGYGHRQDYFRHQDGPPNAARDPLDLLMKDRTRFSIPWPREGVDEYWFEIFTYEWRARFFAAVEVNGVGPFFLMDDPGLDVLKAEADLELEELVSTEKRFIRVALPKGVVKARNEVRVVLRPWLHRTEVDRPFLLLQGLALRPAEDRKWTRRGDPVSYGRGGNKEIARTGEGAGD